MNSRTIDHKTTLKTTLKIMDQASSMTKFKSSSTKNKQIEEKFWITKPFWNTRMR